VALRLLYLLYIVMKYFVVKSLSKMVFVGIFMLMSFTVDQTEKIEFSCVKTHKATNTCHFNFTVDGVKYRYIDMGCKYNRNVQEVLKKVKDGSLALAKDWIIDCPKPRDKKERDFDN
jgi:hypothetical protein